MQELDNGDIFEDFDIIDDDQNHRIEDLVEAEAEKEFPGFTEFTQNFNLCGRPVYTIEAIGAKFWGNWEIQPFYPITILLVIFSSYFFSVMLVFPLFDDYPLSLCISFTAIFILYVFSYVKIILEGPGYFPFSFPKRIPDKSMKESEFSPAGIISTNDQYAWAKQQTGPDRCVLSSTARRYVIKPDHYCSYAASWIGKRNMKFCFLFSFWGSVFHIVFIALAFWGMMASTESVFSFIVLFIFAMIALPFFGLSVYRTYITARAIILNQMSWERWNDVEKIQYNKGIWYNLQDVFGQKNILTWLLPISPFGDQSNEELVKNYDEYTMIDVHTQRKKRRHREKEKRRELREQQRREKALRKLQELRKQQRALQN